MALFGNPQESNLRACSQMIESVLTDRGVSAEGSRIQSDEGPAWSVTQGSAQIFIFLTPGRDGDNFIQVVSPVWRPTQEVLASPQFLRRLLELNAIELTGAAFGLRGDEVVLSTDRSTTGLDRVEVEEMIHRVSQYADEYDDALQHEFGSSKH